MIKRKKGERQPSIRGDEGVSIENGAIEVKRPIDLVEDDDENKVIQKADIGCLGLHGGACHLERGGASEKIDGDSCGLRYKKRDGNDEGEDKTDEELF